MPISAGVACFRRRGRSSLQASHRRLCVALATVTSFYQPLRTHPLRTAITFSCPGPHRFQFNGGNRSWLSVVNGANVPVQRCCFVSPSTFSSLTAPLGHARRRAAGHIVDVSTAGRPFLQHKYRGSRRALSHGPLAFDLFVSHSIPRGPSSHQKPKRKKRKNTLTT